MLFCRLLLLAVMMISLQVSASTAGGCASIRTVGEFSSLGGSGLSGEFSSLGGEQNSGYDSDNDGPNYARQRRLAQEPYNKEVKSRSERHSVGESSDIESGESDLPEIIDLAEFPQKAKKRKNMQFSATLPNELSTKTITKPGLIQSKRRPPLAIKGDFDGDDFGAHKKIPKVKIARSKKRTKVNLAFTLPKEESQVKDISRPQPGSAPQRGDLDFATDMPADDEVGGAEIPRPQPSSAPQRGGLDFTADMPADDEVGGAEIPRPQPSSAPQRGGLDFTADMPADDEVGGAEIPRPQPSSAPQRGGLDFTADMPADDEVGGDEIPRPQPSSAPQRGGLDFTTDMPADETGASMPSSNTESSGTYRSSEQQENQRNQEFRSEEEGGGANTGSQPNTPFEEPINIVNLVATTGVTVDDVAPGMSNEFQDILVFNILEIDTAIDRNGFDTGIIFVAAGDEEANYNIQIEPFIASTRGFSSKHKDLQADQRGVHFAIARECVDLTVGLSYNLSKINVRHSKNKLTRQEILLRTESIFGKYLYRDFLFSAIVKLGQAKVKQRSLAADTYQFTGQTKGILLSYGAYVESPMLIKGNFSISPKIGFKSDYFTIRPITLRHQGQQVLINRRKANRTMAQLGATFSTATNYSGYEFKPYIYIGYERLLGKRQESSQISFVQSNNVTSFASSAPRLDREKVAFNPGIKINCGDKLELGLNYYLGFNRSNISQVANLHLNFLF